MYMHVRICIRTVYTQYFIGQSLRAHGMCKYKPTNPILTPYNLRKGNPTTTSENLTPPPPPPPPPPPGSDWLKTVDYMEA